MNWRIALTYVAYGLLIGVGAFFGLRAGDQLNKLFGSIRSRIVDLRATRAA